MQGVKADARAGPAPAAACQAGGAARRGHVCVSRSWCIKKGDGLSAAVLQTACSFGAAPALGIGIPHSIHGRGSPPGPPPPPGLTKCRCRCFAPAHGGGKPAWGYRPPAHTGMEGGGIENEILQPEAASLIEAQPQQRGPGGKGRSRQTAGRCLSKKKTQPPLPNRLQQSLPGRMMAAGPLSRRRRWRSRPAAAHDVRMGILRRLQQQLERPLPEQVIIIAEGQKYSPLPPARGCGPRRCRRFSG